jgi:hypothetical protein
VYLQYLQENPRRIIATSGGESTAYNYDACREVHGVQLRYLEEKSRRIITISGGEVHGHIIATPAEKSSAHHSSAHHSNVCREVLSASFRRLWRSPRRFRRLHHSDVCREVTAYLQRLQRSPRRIIPRRIIPRRIIPRRIIPRRIIPSPISLRRLHCSDAYREVLSVSFRRLQRCLWRIITTPASQLL